jgi:MtN3 and saliva related transmembrane protein
MEPVIILSIVAGICSSMSFLPQVIKTYKDKEAEDISMSMYAIVIIGLSLWTIIGIIYQNMAMVFFNGLAVSLCVVEISLKLKYHKINKRGE